MEKKHVLYYDLIKIVAAFMVCFYHLGLLDVGTVSEAFYVPNINKLILNLCAMSVPLFFMVNGALMLRRPYSIKEIFLRFLKIIFLYYFWVLVLNGIGTLIFQVEWIPLTEVLKGNRTTISVHLWFLRTMAILTLLVPAMKKIYDQKSKILLYGLLSCVFVFPFLYNYFVLVVRWLQVDAFESLSVTGVFTMYSILYFFLGKIISDISAKQTGKCKKYKVMAMISIIAGWLLVSAEVTLWSNLQGCVYDGVNSSFPTIGALLMAVGVFYLLSKIEHGPEGCVRGLLKICAGNIMGVFIFHTVCVNFVLKVIHRTVSVPAALIITLLIMLATALVTNVLKKIPVIRELLSI